MPKYGCRDRKYQTKSLPRRIFSSLRYIDEQYTTDEGVRYSLTSYSYKALTTERISAWFENPSDMSPDSVETTVPSILAVYEFILDRRTVLCQHHLSWGVLEEEKLAVEF